MKVDVKNEEQNKILLTIEVEAEKIDQAYQKKLAKVSREIKIDGFRKGKAPINMVKNAVGEEYIYKEVLDFIISDTYPEAVYLKNITPIANPVLKEINTIEKGKPFSYKILLEVKPKIELENYLNLEIEQEKKEIRDKDADKQLEEMQKRLGKLVNIEEVGACNGVPLLAMNDFASCDYEIRKEDEKEKKPVKEQIIKVQDYKELPGFAENIIGLKQGEEKEFNLEVKEDEKTIKLFVKFKLHEIKKETFPPLDDDFVKLISGYYPADSLEAKAQTLDQLKDAIKNNLIKTEEEKEKHEIRNKILEKIIETNTIQLNQNMIDFKINHLMHDFKKQLDGSNLDISNYLKAVGKTEMDLRADFKPQGEKAAKIELALDFIAEKEKLEITDEELEIEYEKLAKSYKKEKETIKKDLEDTKVLNILKSDLLHEKVINYLVEKSNIKYVSK